jgi:hypothetical protein
MISFSQEILLLLQCDYDIISIKNQILTDMRAITEITIQEEIQRKGVTCFLTYNNNPNDYSFASYKSTEEAINSLPKNDPYFPLKTDTYRHLIIKGNKTLSDENKSLR